MCNIGDIIIIDKYIAENGKEISKHSFVVISNEKGIISGLSYDLVTNVLSSFKNEEHKIKKLKYQENVFLPNENILSLLKNSKDGYIKADKIFYFQSNKTKYYVFGKISDEAFEKLNQTLINLNKNNKLENVTSNLE